MRNTIKHFVCCILCFVLVAMSLTTWATSAPGAMNATWSAQYAEQITLTITFESPAPYAQQVTAVMYPASVTGSPAISDYCRIVEVTSLYGAKTEITFVIGNDLSAADGKYKVKLQGNGYLSGSSLETIEVEILNPTNAGILLENINGATTNTAAAGYLADGEDALQIALETDPTKLDSLMTAFRGIRANDYSNRFQNLNELRQAYLMSDIMVYLKSGEVTAAGLRGKVEASATLLNLDITDEDYLAKADTVYAKVINLKNTYGGTGIQSCSQLVDAIRKTTAVTVVNDSDMTTIVSAIDKYKTLIGITDEYYSKYTSYSEANQQKVLRQVYNKNFTLATEIKTAFENGVDGAVLSDPDDGGSTGNGGGNGGGVVIGGGNKETITPAETGFTDVSASHWAYTYTQALSQSGIISGYPDGSYGPENTVTREEFVKMIVSAAGLYDASARCEFDDVENSAWYYSFVASAKNNGVVNGLSETSFGSGMNITRQDVAVIVARLIDRFAGTDSAGDTGVQTAFVDNDSVGEYAKASINILVNMGIINGYEDNTFKPSEPLTRAQAAKIIFMFREVI